ncbi:MAG: phosphatase PAP2 family protein [Rhizobacter sp.]|nr:phosphatase PAP2 family protein [Rhizobacter sp.]
MHGKRQRHASPWPEESHPIWLERELWIARERAVALWMHRASTRDWVVRVLDTVSRVGDGWIWYAIVVCLPIAGGPVGTSASVRAVAVGAVNLILYRIIKRWIARPRPYRTCPGICARARSLDEFSFPSGHTLHSVAFSVILTVYYPVSAVFVWPLTILIALSRIVLGLHYPSDVVVGALIGGFTAAVSFNLL